MSSRRGRKQYQYPSLNGLLVLLLLSLKSTAADGNIGCLYFDELCNTETERCYDDNAFGKCIYKIGFLAEDLYRYNLNYHQLEKLKQELEELLQLGFNWKHPYTQCIIQTELYAVRFNFPYNGDLCEQILKQEITDPVRFLQQKQRLLVQPLGKSNDFGSSNNEGIVKYEPDDDVIFQPFSAKSDYFMPQRTDYETELLNKLRIQPDSNLHKFKKSMKSTSSRYRGTPLYLPVHNRKPENEEAEGDLFDNGYLLNENNADVTDWSASKYENIYNDFMNIPKALDIMNNEKAYSEGGPMFISSKKTGYEDANVYDKILDQYGPNIFGFQRSERLDVKKPGPYYKVNNYAFGNMNSKTEDGENKEPAEDDTVPKRKITHRNVENERTFNEQKSNYQYVPNHGNHISRSDSPYVTIETNNKLTLPLVSQFLGTVTQTERIPTGALKNIRILGNAVTFTVGPNIMNYSASDIKRLFEQTSAGKSIQGIDIKKIYVGQPNELDSFSNSVDTKQYTVVDSDYAYIQLKKPIASSMDAERIIELLSSFLRLPKKTFYDVKTGVSEIAFKVYPNALSLNASEVARKIDLLRNEINSALHIEIVSVGIGDKDKLPTAVRLLEKDNNLYKLTFIVCGAIVAVLISAAALFYVKKQSQTKDKILISRDKEFGKDYEECRSKMSAKPNQENSVTGQRITSLSRESDNSPSSRSSTSSWSEEPMTNMDITTGHMVLAYMEDHLTNKARLDTEWAALCAYDADPCSVSIAQLPENIRKNRYVNALPYDHARVILNALSNINGSDYINASTITDHDPRNAAYIATQGPLENTVCDFWQMIWEQGCVVIVMLTRLVENDTSMCHRYWPLEGAELYNIYEVHLVSEHIWCDDFLVRSFYLKNLKTTETRTVTQFHFLTWPEGGIPSAIKPLLEFRRKVNKSFRGRSCPIVVHCSDGVGRTGCYLLLDMVLNRISKGAKEIDIAATLEHIRDQRAGAVCTKQQFQFVLSAVAEEVQAILRALPQQQQAVQDQNADNVAPLVQISSEPLESVVTTSSTDASKTNTASSNGTREQCTRSSK